MLSLHVTLSVMTLEDRRRFVKDRFETDVAARRIFGLWRTLVQAMIRVAQQLAYLGYYSDKRTFASVGYVPFSERPRAAEAQRSVELNRPRITALAPADVDGRTIEADVVVVGSGAAGAEVSEDALADAALVVSVGPLDPGTVRALPAGTATISFLPTMQSLDLVADLRDCGITSFAMELVPRISRAQSMDALSSQALVAGYRCAIVAAGMLRSFFPLNMTAAGTVPPAQVVVLGELRPQRFQHHLLLHCFPIPPQRSLAVAAHLGGEHRLVRHAHLLFILLAGELLGLEVVLRGRPGAGSSASGPRPALCSSTTCTPAGRGGCTGA